MLLAVFAVAAARSTGADPVVFQPNVGNRFRPGLAGTVSPVMQNGLCAIEVPAATVDDVVALTRRRLLTAYKHAYYDPAGREELIARVSRERGEPVDIRVCVNDRRLKVRDRTGPPPTLEQVRAAVPRGSFEWQHKQDEFEFYPLYLTIDDVPDTIQLTVTTDLHHLAPDAVEACVRGMQEVAVAAALDPATRTRT